jgi:stage II sporulation protein D
MGEGSVFRSAEGLKAMAVAARTYSVRFRGRHEEEGFDLCDTTHCQRFDETATNVRVKDAVARTAGETLLFEGRPASAYYSLDCGGRTEDVRRVWPGEMASYLKSREDSYCRREARSGWHWEVGPAELRDVLAKAGLRTPVKIDHVQVVERTPESGRVATVMLRGYSNSARMSASSLRFAIGRAFGFGTVRSDLYQVGVSSGRIVFDGSGSGHGVGLCQRGADRMGMEGRGYREILRFYFPGTELGSVLGSAGASRLTWKRVAGERIVLWTTQPDRDGAVLPVAERLLRSAEARARLAARSIALRVYPNVGSFIEVTGEPGWVAARVSGSEIELQPIEVLRQRSAFESTLKHELMHLLIEGHARAGLPVWFREGLTEYWAGSGAAGAATARDRDLRQTADEERARAAYDAARQQVAALVGRYGETAVVSWLTNGLPREVTNASARPPVTKSR